MLLASHAIASLILELVRNTHSHKRPLVPTLPMIPVFYPVASLALNDRSSGKRIAVVLATVDVLLRDFGVGFLKCSLISYPCHE